MREHAQNVHSEETAEGRKNRLVQMRVNAQIVHSEENPDARKTRFI